MQNNNKLIPWFNWAISTAFVLLQFFLQAAAGLMANSWQQEFHISPSQLGYLTAAFYYSYVIMQIPVGLCYDRFKAKHVLLFASATLALGVIALSYSTSFWQAFFSRIVMGIGSSFGFVGMLCITSAWFDRDRFTLLIGISETLAMLGVSIVITLMGWGITAYGWRFMMLLNGVVILLLNGLIILAVRDYGHSSKETISTHSIICSIKKILSAKLIWQAGIYGFAVFAIINVVVALWGIPFLQHSYPHYSLKITSALMSLVFLGTAVGAPLNGWLGLYYSRQFIMASFALASFILFGFVIYSSNLSITALGILLFLIGIFGSSYIQVFAIVREGSEKSLQASSLATVNMILMSSAPILQPLVGRLLELHFTFAEALSIIELLLLVAFVLAFKMGHQKKTKKRAKRS